MPLTDHTICPSPLAANDEILAWLCDEDNRVDRRGNPHQFLNSVHQWLHVHGSVTSAQRGAVGRIMRGERRLPGVEARAVTPDIDVDARPLSQGTLDEIFGEAPAPTADRGEANTGAHYNRAATWEEGAQTPAGIFTVRLDDEDDEDDDPVNPVHRFKIHIISRSRNNPDLVGKRVVSRQQADGSWTTFGFVTRRGRLKLWNRFNDQATAQWARAADGLLHILSTTDAMTGTYTDFQAAAPTDDGSDEWWHIQEIERHCRVCSEVLRPPGSMDHRRLEFRPSLHSTCANRGFRAEAREPRQVRRAVSMPRSEPITRTPPAAPRPATPAMSELGTGWLQ